MVRIMFVRSISMDDYNRSKEELIHELNQFRKRQQNRNNIQRYNRKGNEQSKISRSC